MSVNSFVLMSAAAVAVALGAAALHTAWGLRRQVTALHAELVAARTDAATAGTTGLATVPAARTAPADATPLADIRAAVADALAEERERELAEARAFWAAQEARDAADAPPLIGGADLGAEGAADAPADRPGAGREDRAELRPFLPRQADLAGLEPLLGPDALDPYDALESVEALDAPELEHVEEAAESAELAAARRRHPSHPDFSPSPVISDHERTVTRLEQLARHGVPLADVRPGPLGTLDVYVFTDGTTLCLTPGDRDTAERLAAALRAEHTPVLLGGSGISGGYALTFCWGEGRQESVYILADRVIASL
ncbi:hypothetical protein [Streptomyces natalensis]|uniref:Secreted protein n=1 Tax=Streptomyces natalensis ATCC 27448 TaxID=1240678 RepID=A0A0D7CS96_9ACTN|nr:hypothetical protein [Streptomyces natalensis]KIZ19129.1 hypothetical protein SNA_04195 [Streptomyces natalensis ATCC 27448]